MSSADEKPEGKWNFENEETGQTAPISKGQGELFGFTQRDIDEMTNPEPISYVSTWNEKKRHQHENIQRDPERVDPRQGG